MAYFSRKREGLNPYAAGGKIYGSGRSFPTMGPVDKLGYIERDLKHAARRSAMIRKLKALKNKNYASADAQRKV